MTLQSSIQPPMTSLSFYHVLLLVSDKVSSTGLKTFRIYIPWESSRNYIHLVPNYFQNCSDLPFHRVEIGFVVRLKAWLFYYVDSL